VTPDPAAAAAYLKARFDTAPRFHLILGSGLGGLVDLVEDPARIPFDEVPGLPAAGVAGHSGTFVGGRLAGVPVLLQAGRYHVYEGHSMDVVVAPARIAAALGVEAMVVTNAAGGIARDLEPGDLAVIDDHINLLFRSPLAGPVVGSEARFPDMSEPYDRALQELARTVALEIGVELKRGVYAAVTGPSYETAAEVRMIGRMGADLVGMSTVPEVTVAAALGMRCLGFSMVTNKGTGLSLDLIGHDEVMEVGQEAGVRLGRLVQALLPRIPSPDSSTSAK